jgi:hypothetical protein
LNEEFEGQYDTAKYEKKISHLMHHAYKRLRNEDATAQRTWDDAIRRLKRGDHYLLVLWDMRPGIHTPELIVLGMIIFGFAAFLGLKWITNRFAPPNPHLLLAVFVAIVIACYFFQNQVGKAFGWLLDKTLFRLVGPGKGGDDSE